MSVLEPVAFGVALVGLTTLNLHEGARRHDLEARLALAPRELYQRLAKSELKWQIVDVRPDVADYDDAHIPGAIPYPGCDPAQVPAAAKERILGSVPTIIVSGDGDPSTFEKCGRGFTSARNLEGGMTAWSDSNLPEDSGEYAPPRSSAGGGCL